MRVWYGLSLFWSNAGLNVLYLRGIFAIRSCLPWVGFRKTQVFLVQMWIFGWDVHFCKIRNISLFPPESCLLRRTLTSQFSASSTTTFASVQLQPDSVCFIVSICLLI